MKRAAELRSLSSDHHRALVIAKRARRSSLAPESVVAEAWREMEQYYECELEGHFCREEDHLVPHLESVGEMALVGQLSREHEAMRACFAAEASRTPEALSRFGDLLGRHVRFEERELFKVAQEVLSQEVLASIERACG